MKRSTILATCLVNSKMITPLPAAEARVRQVFADCFPEQVFSYWNREVNEQVAQNIISNVGVSSTIHVDRFILERLWDELAESTKRELRRGLNEP